MLLINRKRAPHADDADLAVDLLADHAFCRAVAREYIYIYNIYIYIYLFVYLAYVLYIYIYICIYIYIYIYIMHICIANIII